MEFVSISGGRRIDAADAAGLHSARTRTRRVTPPPRAGGKRCGITIADDNGRFKLKSGKGRLAVLAEPDIEEGVEAGTIAADWIADEFSNDPSRSIVTSLKRALDTAHRRLYRENLRSLSSARRSAAVGCVALREQDIYLAQIGPVLAIRLRGGELSLIGQEFTPGPLPFASCLGQNCKLEPQLTRESLRPGDAIAICTTGMLQIGEEHEIAECLGRGNADSITAALFNLHQASSNPTDFTALVVAVGPDSNAERRTVRPIRSRHERQGLPESSNERPSPRNPAYLRAAARAGDRPSPREHAESAARRPRRQVDLPRIGLFALVPMVIVAALSFGVMPLAQEMQARLQTWPLIAGAAENERQPPANPQSAPTLASATGLPAARKLIDLGQEYRASDPSQIIVVGADIYVLDTVSDRIWRYQLDQTGKRAQTSQDPVIANGADRAAAIQVGQLVGMAWVPAGGQRERPGLVFVNQAGGIFQYDPVGGLAALKGPGPGFMTGIKTMGGYAGALYVLSPQQRKLVWYQPTAQGYERAPFNYINPETQFELADAVDFAVDGSLFILHSNGRIERFDAGKLQPFDSSIPDVPLKAPTAIFAASSVGSVYVVDTGNQRVVQYSRDGHYERQLRYGGPLGPANDAFRNIRGINVNDEQGRIYVLADKSIFVVDLPR